MGQSPPGSYRLLPVGHPDRKSGSDRYVKDDLAWFDPELDRVGFVGALCATGAIDTARERAAWILSEQGTGSQELQRRLDRLEASARTAYAELAAATL